MLNGRDCKAKISSFDCILIIQVHYLVCIKIKRDCKVINKCKTDDRTECLQGFNDIIAKTRGLSNNVRFT